MTEQTQTLTLPDEETLFQRAAYEIRGKERERIWEIIHNDYESYRRNPSEQSTARPIRRLWFFLQYTGATNVKDIQNKLQITDYVELPEHDLLPADEGKKIRRGETCEACGANVHEYIVIKRDSASEEVHKIGYDCARRMQEFPSVDFGLIKRVEDLGKEKREKRIQELEDLVSGAVEGANDDSKGLEVAGWIAQALEQGDVHDPTLGLAHLRSRGSYAQWLWDQPVPLEIGQLLREAANPHVRLPRHKQKQLWQHFAEHALIATANYGGIIEDLNFFAQDLLTPAHKELFSQPNITVKQMESVVLTALPFDLRKARKEHNEQTLKNYEGFVLARALDEILPVYEMDKGRWHEEYVAQQCLYQKALTKSDYALIRKITKRWLSGVSRSPEGHDRTKLYHLATRIEPVKRFEEIVPKLASIQRKIAYARATLTSKDYEHLKAISAELQQLASPDEKIKVLHERVKAKLADPRRVIKQHAIPIEHFDCETGLGDLTALLTKLERSYAETDRTWAKHYAHLDRVKEHKQHRFLTDADIKAIKGLDKRVNTFIRIDDLDDQYKVERLRNYKNMIRKVQKAATDPLVLVMNIKLDGKRTKKAVKDRECFAQADALHADMLVQLRKRTSPELRGDWITIATGDYDELCAVLNGTGLTEQQVLAMKSELEEFAKLKPVIFDPEHDHVRVLYKPFSLQEIVRERALKYVSPDDVKKLKDYKDGLVRVSELAKDTEFRRKLEQVIAGFRPEYIRYSKYDKERPANDIVDAANIQRLFSDDRVKQDTFVKPIYTHKKLKDNVNMMLENLPYYQAAYERRTAVAQQPAENTIEKLRRQYLGLFYERVRNDEVLCRLVNGITAGEHGDFTRTSLTRQWVERLFTTFSRHTGPSETALTDALQGQAERLGSRFQSEWGRKLERFKPYATQERNAYMSHDEYAKVYQPAVQKLAAISDQVLLGFMPKQTS
jgi:hypothetical protein